MGRVWEWLFYSEGERAFTLLGEARVWVPALPGQGCEFVQPEWLSLCDIRRG